MKKVALTLSVLVLSSSLLFGCGMDKPNEEAPKAEVTQSENQANQSVSLKRWEGKWTSLEAVLSTAEAEKAAELEAKEEGIDKAVLIETQKKRLMSPIASIEINGDKISLVEKDDKKSEGTYQFVRNEMAMRGTEETHWDIFKSEDTNLAYPFIALSETHGDDGYAHFHARFGKTEAALFEDKANDPTFIDEKTPVEIMSEEVFE